MMDTSKDSTIERQRELIRLSAFYKYRNDPEGFVEAIIQAGFPVDNPSQMVDSIRSYWEAMV